MKYLTIFDEIIATCALVSLPAIIPSLMEYQYQLKVRIDLLCTDLKQKGYSDDVIDALCRLSCHALDLTTQRNLQQEGLSWQGYELELLFYGPGDDCFFTEQHADLLAQQTRGELTVAVGKLFCLSSFPYPQTPRGSGQHPLIAADSSSSPATLSQDDIATTDHKSTLLWHDVFWTAKAFIPILTCLFAVWLSCYFYLY
ncbi:MULTISPECIES: hypothetical protein [Rosenbergiella]|uniref:hypothetical protein n=1 Tax=Rosenbergiella TaxID=1356488 RepID=UPI001F4D5C59|nr:MULTISPECIES: hypothetical protein [Rosenbergiella]